MSRPPGRTAVYRLYDDAGDLLYVGVAKNPPARWKYHARHKAWWQEVADREICWHADRDAALRAEAAAIEHEPGGEVEVAGQGARLGHGGGELGGRSCGDRGPAGVLHALLLLCGQVIPCLELLDGEPEVGDCRLQQRLVERLPRCLGGHHAFTSTGPEPAGGSPVHGLIVPSARAVTS